MSYDCGKALRGWCRSFTRTERWLTVLEAIFLVVLISFLTYLILHLLACSCSADDIKIHVETSSEELLDSNTAVTPRTASATSPRENNTDGRNCSWTPAFKTTAVTRYYLDELQTPASKKTPFDYLLPYDVPDVVDADTVAGGSVLALVRVRPRAFGCILAVASEYWTVTSASCIDTVKIFHRRDLFVMVGDRVDLESGHGVSEVKMHPKYRSNSTRYDLCALKSNTSLQKDVFLRLPTPIDYFLTVMGDRLTVFGYRRNRSSGVVRAAAVRVLSVRRCAAGGVGGRAVCAGRRGGACGAGSPLLRGRTLLAVRAGRGGGDCAPAEYRSLAPHVPWLHSLDPSINYLF